MARVLITGCSTGFGRAAAVELTKRGHEVLATARRPETLDDLDVAQKLRLDVDDDASVAAAVASAGTRRRVGEQRRLRDDGPVERLPIDEFRRMFETNFFGAVRMIQAVLPQMRERGSGTIVNVTSLAGLVTAADSMACTRRTKFALEAVSRGAALRGRALRHRVALVEPGFFETEFSGQRSRGSALDDAAVRRARPAVAGGRREAARR